MNTSDIPKTTGYGPAPGSSAEASIRARHVPLAACPTSAVSIPASVFSKG